MKPGLRLSGATATVARMSPVLTAPVVSTQWLADHLGADDMVVVDASVLALRDDDGTPTGRYVGGHDQYLAQGHVPGAVFADLIVDLSDDRGATARSPGPRPSASPPPRVRSASTTTSRWSSTTRVPGTGPRACGGSSAPRATTTSPCSRAASRPGWPKAARSTSATSSPRPPGSWPTSAPSSGSTRPSSSASSRATSRPRWSAPRPARSSTASRAPTPARATSRAASPSPPTSWSATTGDRPAGPPARGVRPGARGRAIVALLRRGHLGGDRRARPDAARRAQRLALRRVAERVGRRRRGTAADARPEPGDDPTRPPPSAWTETVVAVGVRRCPSASSRSSSATPVTGRRQTKSWQRYAVDVAPHGSPTREELEAGVGERRRLLLPHDRDEHAGPEGATSATAEVDGGRAPPRAPPRRAASTGPRGRRAERNVVPYASGLSRAASAVGATASSAARPPPRLPGQPVQRSAAAVAQALVPDGYAPSDGSAPSAVPVRGEHGVRRPPAAANGATATLPSSPVTRQRLEQRRAPRRRSAAGPWRAPAAAGPRRACRGPRASPRPRTPPSTRRRAAAARRPSRARRAGGRRPPVPPRPRPVGRVAAPASRERGDRRGRSSRSAPCRRRRAARCRARAAASSA